MNEEQLKAIRDRLVRIVFSVLLDTLTAEQDTLELAQYKKDNIPEVRISFPSGDLVIIIGAEWQVRHD